jgi:hypothetical protein
MVTDTEFCTIEWYQEITNELSNDTNILHVAQLLPLFNDSDHTPLTPAILYDT